MFTDKKKKDADDLRRELKRVRREKYEAEARYNNAEGKDAIDMCIEEITKCEKRYSELYKQLRIMYES